jgi:hypothetical protein
MNNRITIQFISDNKVLTSIQCLKVFSENQLNKIGDKISLIKDGGILYPTKISNKHPGKNLIYLTKEGKVVKDKKDSFYVIEMASKTISEIKNCDAVRMFSEIMTTILPIVEKDEAIVDKLVNEKIGRKSEPITWKEVKNKSMDVLKKAEKARTEATEADGKIETIVI